ncbi:MAG TPA: penicillin-binding transpeptidase domain-containing protein [Pyrinomonadaceae bacterium]|nr:penicillin-binding transpeptidase domain-containing protein [Pyrinomonadaceae bacterium]
MRLRVIFLTALLLLAALGCTKTTGAGPVVNATQARSSAATQPDLASYFKPYPAGAFVLYDLKRGAYVRYNEARCRERFSPYSTFKIPNSLIGLDAGVITDAEFRIEWDEKKYPAFNRDTLPFSAWWQDQTLRTAFKRSVVWYYRELALKVGEKRMKEYVDKLDYGNEDASGPLNGFWLNSSLKISADEQVEFLKRLHKEDLPVAKRSIKILKEIMTLEETPGYRLSGKTGGGSLGENRYLGWFVGYLETEENTYFFATEIEGPTYLSIRDERIAVTKRILADLGHMPGQ